MKAADKINIPDWAQGTVLVGGLALIGLTVIRKKKEKDQKQVEDLVFSTGSNPFNWREFFSTVKAGTIVTRFSDGGVAEAKRLYNLFGFFNEDETAIDSFFAGIRTQYQVAQIAKRMFEVHKIELSTLLIDGRGYWLPNIAGGLSDKQIAKIYQVVKNKPKLRI
jgi:hypothetical protein